MPLIVWITPFTLFSLRLTSRFRDVNGSPFFVGGASCAGMFARISWRTTPRRSESSEFRLLTSSAVLGGPVFEEPDGFNPERGFPRRQNAVTTALRWSDVRMQQRGSATFRVLAAAIVKRYTAATRESQRGLTGFCAKLRSCRGASARGFHHFAGQPCSFRRDCTYESRHVRVSSQASGGKRCGGGCVAAARSTAANSRTTFS